MTVIQDATVGERVAQALKFLDQAEAEFAMGDTGQAAELEAEIRRLQGE